MQIRNLMYSLMFMFEALCDFTASTRRSVQKKAPADDEDEDEDEDSGDDDSFINDDSEDAGDDSDYLPPDSDDSGKEDVKRLQREAKAFVKRGK